MSTPENSRDRETDEFKELWCANDQMLRADALRGRTDSVIEFIRVNMNMWHFHLENIECPIHQG